MLLGPQLCQQWQDPSANSQKTVEACVAAGADGDQHLGSVETGLPVMHVQPLDRAAGAAPMAVAIKNFLSQSGKPGAGVGEGAVARAAESADGGKGSAAGAKERPLGRETATTGQKFQRTVYSRIAVDNRYYRRLFFRMVTELRQNAAG